MNYINRIISSAFAVLMIVCISISAFADWSGDLVKGTTWLDIEGDGFVADTFCGVEARYNTSDYYYQCNELIMRFYDEAFNLDVYAFANLGLIMNTSGYGFEKVTGTPTPGDVIYAPAAQRGAATDHWAIVKSYSDGVITLFEQNVVWNGKAAKNRKIKYPSSSYNLYTPVSTNGGAKPSLKASSAQPSSAADISSVVTEISTSVVTSIAESEKTTIVTITPVSTTKVTTTAETTTAFTTTVKETSLKATSEAVSVKTTTTALHSDYSEKPTAAVELSIEEITDVSADEIGNEETTCTEYSEETTELIPEPINEDDFPPGEILYEDETIDSRITVVLSISAAVLLAACITGIIFIKRRQGA